MNVDLTTEEREELYTAFSVIRLVIDSLYAIEDLFSPYEGVPDAETFLKIFQVRVNFANEASSLLPNALKVINSHISSKEV